MVGGQPSLQVCEAFDLDLREAISVDHQVLWAERRRAVKGITPQGRLP